MKTRKMKRRRLERMKGEERNGKKGRTKTTALVSPFPHFAQR